MYLFELSYVISYFAATRAGQELDWNAPPFELDQSMFCSALRRTICDQDCNGWSDPGGKGFMIRSKTYDENRLKVCSTLLINLLLISSFLVEIYSVSLLQHSE